MALQTQRIAVATDVANPAAVVVPVGTRFFGFWIESQPAGLTVQTHIGPPSGNGIIFPVGGGLVDECDPTTVGLFASWPVNVPGGEIVYQVQLGASQQQGA